MTCQALANQYATSTSNPIPAVSESVDTRGKWLLTQQWGCIGTDGQPNYLPASDPNSCENQIVPVPNDQGGTDELKGAPRTLLQEFGFMAWINSRAAQCINSLTGLFIPGELPNKDVQQPLTYCSSACLNFSAAQETCFECIKHALEDNKLTTACPSLYNGNSLPTVDTNLMQQSVTCQTCIANNSTNLMVPVNITDAAGTVVYSQEYNPKAFENVWNCVTGAVPGLTIGAIIGIVLACIVVLIGVVLLSVYLVRRRERLKIEKVQTSDVK